MNSAYFYLMILSALGIMTAIALWFILQFKHRFIIHEMTGSRNIVHVVKFREVNDKDGTTWWQLLQQRQKFGEKIKPSPSNVLMITPKGKISVEACWSKSYKFQFIVPKMTKDKSDYDCITDEQKAIYLKKMREEKEWEKPSFSDLVMKFAGYGMVIVLVVALMVFYGDMAKPLLSMGSQLQSFQDKQLEMMRMFQEVIQNKQWISEDYVPPQFPGNFTPPS